MYFAKKEIEEDFNESIQQQFDDSDNITDKGIADYAEKLTEVKKLAKYKVQDVKRIMDRVPYALSETKEKIDILAAEMEKYMDERIRNRK